MKEAGLPQQVVRQALSFPLGKEAVLPRQLHTFLLGKETIPSSAGSQAGGLLPPREGSSSSQSIAHLPPRGGSNSPLAGSQADALLPSREGGNPPHSIAHLPPSEGSNSLPAIAHLPSGEGSSSPLAGQTNQARSVRQSLRWSNRHMAPQASQKKQHYLLGRQTHHYPPVGSPRGHLMKSPTLSGSLNLSNKPLAPAQRSVLAKGPNFAVTPQATS